MTTIKSFSETSRFSYLYRSQLRQTLGLNIEINLVFFLIFPLQYILSLISFSNTQTHWDLTGNGDIYNVLSFICFPIAATLLPFLVSAVVFKYMHNKRCVDVYHALPVKRTTLFLAKYFSGLTMVLAPLILSYLIIFASAGFFKAIDIQPIANDPLTVHSTYQLLEKVQQIDFLAILNDMMVWVIAATVLYTIASLAAVNAGTTFDQLLYALGLTFFPVILVGLVLTIFSQFLYGFVLPDIVGFRIFELCPVTLSWIWCYGGAADVVSLTEFNLAMLGWFAVAAILLVVTILVYRRRRSEYAGTVSRRNIVKEILKYVSVFLASQIVGSIFLLVFSSSNGRIMYYIGTLIGAAVCYIIAETIMTRKFSTIPRQIPAIFVSVLLCVCFSWIMARGGLGYCLRVPMADQVQSVEINYVGRYCDQQVQMINEDGDMKYVDRHIVLSSQECKELIVAAHQSIVDDYEENAYFGETYSYNGENMDYQLRPYIKYTFQNGSQLSRQYYNIPKEAAELLQQLNDCEEFIQKTQPLFAVQPDELSSLKLYDALYLNGFSLSGEDLSKEQLLEALKTDLMEHTLSDQLKNAPKVEAYLTFEVNTERQPNVPFYTKGYVAITADYENTLALLEQYGLLERLKIDPQKLEAVYILDSYGGHMSYMNNNLMYASPFTLYEEDLGERSFVELLQSEASEVLTDLEQVQAAYFAGSFLVKEDADKPIIKSYFFRYDGKISHLPLIALLDVETEVVYK